MLAALLGLAAAFDTPTWRRRLTQNNGTQNQNNDNPTGMPWANAPAACRAVTTVNTTGYLWIWSSGFGPGGAGIGYGFVGDTTCPSGCGAFFDQQNVLTASPCLRAISVPSPGSSSHPIPRNHLQGEDVGFCNPSRNNTEDGGVYFGAWKIGSNSYVNNDCSSVTNPSTVRSTICFDLCE